MYFDVNTGFFVPYLVICYPASLCSSGISFYFKVNPLHFEVKAFFSELNYICKWFITYLS